MINKLFDVKYPIFQGAMAHVATAEFGADVSNAGAIGIIGTGAMNAEETRKAIHKCKELTDKPFGVNVMLMNPHTEEIMKVIAEEMLKESGAKVIPVVASVALARRMERVGADAVIVEGGEAGGHVGEQTTMVLVPQVVDAVEIPVIAAGGIADSRGFDAALCLGAEGVQLGTVLLATDECPIHENYKNAVIKAKDMDTVVTGRTAGSPVRVLKNRLSREYMKLEQQEESQAEREKLTIGALRRAVKEGDMQDGSVMMGQIAGLCKEIKPLPQIFEEIVSGSKVVLSELERKIREI